MDRKKIYFLSDLHLGARYIADARAHENRIVGMLESFADDASQIYLLGDVLDYWFEYRTVVPRGYVRFFGILARLADSGIKIKWFTGNHDIWMSDYIESELGVEIVRGPETVWIDGYKFYLAHGDDLGAFNKASFNLIRAVFHNTMCQKLYSGIHPRWTIPFAKRWSSDSRQSNEKAYAEWRGDDIEPSILFAKNYLQNVDSEINYFIMGHRHLAYEAELSPSCRFVLLGDCFREFSYAEWDGDEIRLARFAGR